MQIIFYIMDWLRLKLYDESTRKWIINIYMYMTRFLYRLHKINFFTFETYQTPGVTVSFCTLQAVVL